MKVVSIQILFLTLVMICSGCISNHSTIALTELKIEKNENEIIISNTTNSFQIVQIHGKSFIQKGDLSLELGALVNSYNLYSAYLSSIKGIGALILLEYGLYGASGKAANIIFTQAIKISDNKLIEVFKYNSFLGGADLLSYLNDTLSLRTYKFHINDRESYEYYCRTDFLYKNTFTAIEDEGVCLVLKSDGQLKQISNCACETLTRPFVF